MHLYPPSLFLQVAPNFSVRKYVSLILQITFLTLREKWNFQPKQCTLIMESLILSNTFAVLELPQNGSHLMTPDISKWFLYFLSDQPWMFPWNFRNDYIVAPWGVNSSTDLPIKWGLRTDCCPSSHNHGWVKIGCISNSSYLLTYQNFPLIHDYGRKSEFFQGSSNSLVSNLVASPLLPGSDHCWMDVQFQTIAGRGSRFTGPLARSEINSN